jgi:hypothetical protein
MFHIASGSLYSGYSRFRVFSRYGKQAWLSAQDDAANLSRHRQTAVCKVRSVQVFVDGDVNDVALGQDG